MRSRDEGQSWEEVSPDLTRNDKTKQGLAGGSITRDITGVELYGSIFTLSESPAEHGVIWAGTDDGLVQVTRDACQHWENVTPKGIPEWIRINSIDASPTDKGCAYVAATMYQFDDNHPYLYRTRDYGKSWTRINTGIPEGTFTRVIRADPARRGLLYAGTETGVYVSFDDGGTWQAFQRNLPVTPVTDLAIKNNDLVVATQGRSFWILDDLTPLRNWNAALAAQPFHLFQPPPAYRTTFAADPENPPKNAGQNPPDGVIVDYWLKDKLGDKDVLKLEIFSGDSLIRSFSSEKSAKPANLKEQGELAERNAEKDKPLEPAAGLNRFVWDMRIVKPTLTPRAVFNEGTKAPPKVGAGTYKVVVRMAGHRDSALVEVRPNPEGHATAADLRAQFDLLSAIRDRLSETHVAVMTIRDVRQQSSGSRRAGAAPWQGGRPGDARQEARRQAHRGRRQAHQSRHQGARGRSQLSAATRSRFHVPRRRGGQRGPAPDRWCVAHLRGSARRTESHPDGAEGHPRHGSRRLQSRGAGSRHSAGGALAEAQSVSAERA